MKMFGRLSGMLVLAFVVGCDDDKPSNTKDTTDTQDAVEGDTTEEVSPDTTEEVSPDTTDTTGPSCEYAEPLCSDEQISILGFSKTRSGGAVTEEGTTAGEFLSLVDATAGGFNGTLGYTYARFTAEGLVAVDLSDEESLESTDWDIAFRRYLIRLNSGVSGPSCVQGGRTAPNTTFEGLSEVPASLTFRAEQYFSEGDCELVPDTSGLGAPLMVLSSFWSYPGCVAMSGNVYVLRLSDGRHVKLQIKSYYTPSVQEVCDERNELVTPSGAGNIRVRWAFVD